MCNRGAALERFAASCPSLRGACARSSPAATHSAAVWGEMRQRVSPSRMSLPSGSGAGAGAMAAPGRAAAADATSSARHRAAALWWLAILAWGTFNCEQEGSKAGRGKASTNAV